MSQLVMCARRVASAELEARRSTLAEKLARKERRRERRRRKLRPRGDHADDLDEHDDGQTLHNYIYNIGALDGE